MLPLQVRVDLGVMAMTGYSAFSKAAALLELHCNILICMQKHSQHNKDEQTQFFRKIFLSHFIRNGSKGLRKVYVWEVSWRLNKDCNILTPSSSGYSSTSFLSCGAAQPGALKAQPLLGPGSHSSNCNNWLQTPNSDLQLTQTSSGTGLYNCLTPTCFSERRICTQFNPSTVKVIPRYLRLDAPVIYTGAFLIWQLGQVRGQYVTSPSDCLVSYPEHTLGGWGSFHSAGIQSVYSTAPADWAFSEKLKQKSK